MLPTDINDVAADQGCTSVTRSSHRISPIGVSPNSLFDWHGSGKAGQTVFEGNDVGRTVADGYAPMSSMPNSVLFAARAGDCIIFDLATWHTAQPNTSKLERWNTIQGYHSGAITAHGGTPTGPMMGDEMLAKLAELGRLTPTKRCAKHLRLRTASERGGLAGGC